MISIFHYSIPPWFQYSTTPLFYQVALDELRDDRDHHELDIPFLAKSIRVMNLLCPLTPPSMVGLAGHLPAKAAALNRLRLC
jgi:hypothetical protein